MTTLSEVRPWMKRLTYEELEAENSMLKDRCYFFTHGELCSKCSFECINKEVQNEGQCIYGEMGYDK